MSHLDDFLQDANAERDKTGDNVIDLTALQRSDNASANPPGDDAGTVTDASMTGRHRQAATTIHQAPEVEALLQKVIGLVNEAKTMPLSASSMINKAEVLEVLNKAVESLPEELRAARWLLKEREDYLERMHHEGEELMEVARQRAEQMVQRTDLVRAAKKRAREIVDEAQAESRTMKREAEDYCDQKLASFEGVLERTLRVVGEGRTKLQGDVLAPLASPDEPQVDADGQRSHQFFNQDQPEPGPSGQ